MNLSFTLFLSGSILLLIGSGLILSEYYGFRKRRAKRWRIQIQAYDWWGHRPLSLLKGIIDQRKREKMDLEIYEAISFLRNTTAIGKGAASSTDTIIEQLADHRGLLAPVYGKMLRFLRQNQKENAIQSFIETVGSEFSKDFARLLTQWDEIDPRELTETLLSHQKNIREVRLTIQKRRDEMISDLIYLPVVVNVMLVFLNFIYVAYFLEQKQMLTMLM